MCLRSISIPLRAAASLIVVLLYLPQFIIRVPPTTPPIPPPPNITVGYTSRASGWDLDFNGIIGDAVVCRGSSGGSTVGKDIDNNGVFDREIYVDLTGGTNNSTCGLSSAPCLTIGYAMNGTNSSVTGGAIQAPGAGQIQAICFKGTGTETIVPTQSGATGTYTVPATGHQKRSFKHPRYPFVIAGWDANNNGQYPPYDTGDTAVLDCQVGNLAYAIQNSSNISNMEFGHFTAKNCGTLDVNLAFSSGATHHEGFSDPCPAGGSCDQIYYHDIVGQDIMKGEWNQSFHEGFDMFVGTFTNFDVTNLNFTNIGGGYFARGAGPPTTVVGPYRFQNISLTVSAFSAQADGTTCKDNTGVNSSAASVECTWAGWKIWDYINGTEILDNDFNMNVANWTPHSGACYTDGTGTHCGGAGTVFDSIAYCVQDYLVRGNNATDFKQSMDISPWYGNTTQCYSRNVDQVVIDRNTVRTTYSPYIFGVYHIIMLEGGGTGAGAFATIGSVTITNNYLSWTNGNWEACIWYNGGQDYASDGATIVAAGNTCYGPIGRSAHGCLLFGNVEGTNHTFVGQNFTYKDNIVSNCTGDNMVFVNYAPSTWTVDYQDYDSAGTQFRWNNGGQTNFTTWKSNSGGDTHAVTCTPSFVNAGAGNLDLNGGDTCAKAAGTDISAYTTVDIKNKTRASPTSIGAHDPNGT
jgi:hypothetical protein